MRISCRHYESRVIYMQVRDHAVPQHSLNRRHYESTVINLQVRDHDAPQHSMNAHNATLLTAGPTPRASSLSHWEDGGARSRWAVQRDTSEASGEGR